MDKSRDKWIWIVVPIAAIVLARTAFNLQLIGNWRFWVENLLIVLGWIVGCFLAQADQIFYLGMVKPDNPDLMEIKQLAREKKWKQMWGRIKQISVGDRRPVKNMLTALIIAGLGIWIITSSGSPLGSGVVYGMGMQMFLSMLADKDWEKWYWIFARKFSEVEHKGLVAAWAIVLAVQTLMLVR